MTHRRISVAIAAFTLAVAVVLHASGQADAPLTAVVKAGRVLDVMAGRYESNRWILVQGERIAAVVPADSRTLAGQPEVIDLSSATVLPGLIDAHVHLGWSAGDDTGAAARAAAETTLKAGFTSVRSLGADGFGSVALAREIADGRVPGPRVVAAGPGIGTKGGICEQTFGATATIQGEGEAAAEQIVKRLVDGGAAVIKACAGGPVVPGGQSGTDVELDLDTLRAIVNSAHRHARKVATHATTAAAVLLALSAGVDSIEHGGPMDAATIGRFARQPTYLVPTLYRLDWLIEQQAAQGNNAPVLRATRERLHATMRDAVAAGVRVAFGTDATVIPHGINAREFRALGAIGLEPAEAIKTATVNAADLLGLGTVVGRIAAGYQADLVGVQGDPLADTSTLEQVRFVMKAGRTYLR